VRIVEGLRAEGFSVWWDHGIAPGAQWDQTIQHQLNIAKVVVAVWSEASIAAPWVKEEAGVGKNRGILVPVMIDQVEPPLGFGLIQAANLVGWDGDVKDRRWIYFLGALQAVLNGERPAHLEAPLRKKRLSPWVWALGGVAAMAVLVLGLGMLTVSNLTVSATRPSGAEYEASISRGAPQPLPAPTGSATAQEQELWDKATAEKTRAAFQSYLVAYPNGAFANRARDALLTCRSEEREVWRPGPDVANQMVRGVASVPTDAPTAKAACAKAKGMVEKQAKLMCETIVTNGGYRDAKWTIQDRDCDCNQPNDQVTVCIADLPYACRWEMKLTETAEICGG
jgi:hypothetical protein